MPPSRSDLGERGERETALGESRVRQDGIGRGLRRAAEVQDVDVDLSRTVDVGRAAADPPLDRLDRREQVLRRSVPEDLDRRVQEVRLLRDADWLRGVERRDAPERSDPGYFFERGPDERAPVAEVGAESEPDPAGIRTLLLRPALSLRLRRLRRIRRRRRNRCPRAPAVLRRTRSPVHR